jgi:itaconate CoA-transferase
VRTLEGILVVSLEQAVAAPLASFRLAQAGARVIKVERPEGDFARGYDRAARGQSSYFVWLNGGKESVVLDLKTDADRELLARMVARADVFIQNLAPGAAARLGFDSAELRARHPRLITCDISGYGEDGPWRDVKAYDLLVQAETGLAGITGTPEGPGRVGISICDIATGEAARAAVLEALLQRERTGRGSGVSLSLFATLAELMAVPFLHHRYGTGAPPRLGLAHPSIAPYGVFPTAGEPVLISIQNEREWTALCRDVLDDEGLAGDPRFAGNDARVAHRADLDALIAERFLALPAGELIERLKRAAVAFGRVNDLGGLERHPQLREQAVETPEGTVMLPAPPVRRAGIEPGPAVRVPALDEHGEALRREFGLPGGHADVPPTFDAGFCARLDDLFRWRRDVRRFRRDPVDPEMVRRLIDLACLAPSVGFSQPWRFVLVESAGARAAVRANFLACNAEALGDYAGERARLYAGLKLAGLDEAPVHLAVFTDGATEAGHGLGRRTMPEMLHYSAVTAVHTLWLAARARGIGVGWVSILDPVRLRADLDLPETWHLIAYLCIGHPEEQHADPELERAGWQARDGAAAAVTTR